MFLLSLFKISGHSMIPTFNPNTVVVVSFMPFLFSKPKVNDIVVFVFNNKKIIKRIKEVKDERYFVQGDNKSDSLDIGWIKQKQIIGRVIMKA